MELIAKDDSEVTRYLDHLYDIYNAMAMSNPEVLVLIHCGHIDIALITSWKGARYLQQTVILPFEARLQRRITAGTVPRLEGEPFAPKIENTIFTVRHFMVAFLTCMLLYLGSLTVSEVFIIIALSYFIGLLYYATN